jgi:hypothetical protein
VYDGNGRLREIHHKYPVDLGHQPVTGNEPLITRDALASQLRDYLQHRITSEALVDWAEHAMIDEEFDDRDFETIREITGRLGLADVREFGLTWEDCEGYLSRLGYRTKVDVVQAS